MRSIDCYRCCWLIVSLFVATTFSGRLLADAKPEDVSAATKRVSALGKVAKVTMDGNKLTEIVISEGSQLTDADFLLFGKLTDLTKLQVLNCRVLNTENIKAISGLAGLKSLSITNTVIDDSAVEVIVKSFPNLTELDLSSNANMSNQVMKSISELKGLQTLSLLQNRLDDIGTRRLSKLQDLRVLDLRGNMEAGDMTLGVLAELPKLKALKHRSTAVTDYGLEMLSANGTIENLLLQDFAITDQSGQHLAKLSKLSQLEIFRCQGFGNDGVLALRGLPLQRLTLRDLPVVGDSAMELFKELPKLKRLYLHELSSVSDEGLKSLSGAKAVELLDIWSVPNMTDATLEVIAKLPNLKELSIRETGISNAGIEKLLTIGSIESLTLKENGAVTEEGLKKLAARKWKKLDVGSTKPAQE